MIHRESERSACWSWDPVGLDTRGPCSLEVGDGVVSER